MRRSSAARATRRWHASSTRPSTPSPCRGLSPGRRSPARPRRLSVTEIEHWLRDPYTIYAKHVLGLQPLDDIDTPPGAADRGNLIHDTIGEFARTFPDKHARRSGRGAQGHRRAAFPAAGGFSRGQGVLVAALSPHRRMAGALRDRAARAGSRGSTPRSAAASPSRSAAEEFKLTVRADRIERLKDGRYAVLDYKTGAPPSDKQVLTGLSPQLTLEAAILRQGGFKDIPPGASVAEFVYVRLRGGAVAGEELPVKIKDGTPDESRRSRAVEGSASWSPSSPTRTTPYYSLLHPMWTHALRHLRSSRPRAGVVADRRSDN